MHRAFTGRMYDRRTVRHICSTFDPIVEKDQLTVANSIEYTPANPNDPFPDDFVDSADASTYIPRSATGTLIVLDAGTTGRLAEEGTLPFIQRSSPPRREA